MAKTGLIDKLDQNLYDERTAYALTLLSKEQRELFVVQGELTNTVKEIARSGDVGLILQTERRFIENDLAHYGNSTAMRGSLSEALNQVTAAQTTYSKVHDPVLYKGVDEAHQSNKHRIGTLPRDEVRDFFKRNNARLLNMDKSRLDPSEKEILDARRDAMRSGEKTYIDLQRQALGQEKKKTTTPSFSR